MSHGIRALSLLALTLALTALQLDQAAAGRGLLVKPNMSDKKQPEWLLDPDGSLLIPGIGRVMVPPKHMPYMSHMPYLGGGGSSGPIGGGGGSGMSSPIGGGGGGSMSPPTGRNYIPGRDDTYIPNPGVEVPNPSRGSVPTPNRH